jgi:hypothetical protein
MKTFFILEDDCRFLQWISKKEKYHLSRIFLPEIKNIDKVSTKKLAEKENNHILFINTPKRDFVLQFENDISRDLFWQGL